jgi:hypothetical protein
MTVSWRVRRKDGEADDGTFTYAVDGDLDRLYVRDAINPFANVAELQFVDPDRTKADLYPSPTFVELDVKVEGYFDYTPRFAGTVFDQGIETNGNHTKITVLSHDYWFRKTAIFAEYTNTTLSSILEDLIVNETPLIWDSSRIEIENDVAISRRWAGDQLETIFDEIRAISAGDELYGVTFDREFEFRPLTDRSAPRNFSEGEYYSTSWESDEKRNVNRVVLRYGEGDNEGVVIRNDRSSQREFANEIGSDDPVQIEDHIRRPEITTETRAKDSADQRLAEQSAIETGEIDTWEAFGVKPGQLTEVVDSEQDIDREVRIVETEYEWPGGEPETKLTAADTAIDTVDELVALSDDIARVDLRSADPNAPVLETLDQKGGLIYDLTSQVRYQVFGEERFNPGFGRDLPGIGRTEWGLHFAGTVNQSGVGRATKGLMNTVRDVWRGQQNAITNAAVALGDDDSSAVRFDEALGSELYRGDIVGTQKFGDDTVEFEADVTVDTEQTIREVGLFDSATDNSGTLHGRTVMDDMVIPENTSVTAIFEIAISNDGARESVTTTTAQQHLRNAMAGDDISGQTPTQVAFGTGTADPTVDDTALGNEVARNAIDRFRTAGTGKHDTFATLLESDASGQEISEFGQFNDQDELWARVAFYPIEMTGIDLEVKERTIQANE